MPLRDTCTGIILHTQVYTPVVWYIYTVQQRRSEEVLMTSSHLDTVIVKLHVTSALVRCTCSTTDTFNLHTCTDTDTVQYM
jgi:hypothetical protein